ncbi:MAG: hypothetical protein MUF01_19000 [Bryobacterales bacterium]|jgi:hypothetical protein|nr:hypothetical protein [Bryobacterales bacterium]
MQLAGDILLGMVLLYGLVGFAYAVRFVTRTLDRVSDRARLSGPLFRVGMLPAAVLLWPWLMRWEGRAELAATSEAEAEPAP